MRQLQHFIQTDKYGRNNQVCPKCRGEIVKENGMLMHCKDCGHIINQAKAKQAYKADQKELEERYESKFNRY